MAQHSHCVYGNIYPFQNYYHKRRATSNHNIAQSVHLNNKRAVCKPSEAHYYPEHSISPLPFSNRNSKLHRLNPHLHFGNLVHPAQTRSTSKSSNNVPQKPSHPTPSKWRSEISNAAQVLPRKWCDFVFRRNADNKLYRSESFRFIQKTSSLQLLPPLSVGLNKYRNKRLQVPVSDDYVDPLDHVASTQLPSSGETRNVKAEPDSPADNDRAYNEIIERYNAPYYYSDTIKEPTYCSPCSPCPTWRQSCGDLSVHQSKSSSQDQVGGNWEQRCRSRVSNSSSGGSGSGASMARKRYETAFLPSSSHHPAQSTSPDVDCLLLAIESSCSLVRDGQHDGVGECGCAELAGQGPRRSRSGDNGHNGEREQDRLTANNTSQIASDPSIPYCQSMSQSHSVTHTSGSTTTSSSPLSDKKPKPTMPLSEPLPQKRYSNNMTSSSSSPSNSTSLTSCRPADKRLLMTMMKDNSVSSLESIDSTKSEDLQPFSRPFVGHRGGNQNGYFGRGTKLLSPISDKSPLEPIAVLQSSTSGTQVHAISTSSHHRDSQWPSYQQHLVNTAELINVPWDMPKIKRRLALLADSGISLDYTGNTQSDGGLFPADGDRDRNSYDDSHLQYTSSHIRGNSDLRVVPPSTSSVDKTPNDKNRAHNLQLSFDTGLVQDEYYEDPRLNFNESSDPTYSDQTHQSQVKPKSSPAWVTNVTSVQVHVSGSSGSGEADRPPPRPDRCRMKLDFRGGGNNPSNRYEIDPTIELEAQEWFHGAITRSEAEGILRATKEGSFLVRNCESSSFNRYSLSLKSARGYIHVRIEPNSLGTFSLGEQEFPSVSHLVLHFMYHRLPIKGAEHVKLMYPVITQLL